MELSRARRRAGGFHRVPAADDRAHAKGLIHGHRHACGLCAVAAHPRADAEQLGLAAAARVADYGALRADVLVFLGDGFQKVSHPGSDPLFFCAGMRGAVSGRHRVFHRAAFAADRVADVVALRALSLPRARELAADLKPQSQGERRD